MDTNAINTIANCIVASTALGIFIITILDRKKNKELINTVTSKIIPTTKMQGVHVTNKRNRRLLAANFLAMIAMGSILIRLFLAIQDTSPLTSWRVASIAGMIGFLVLMIVIILTNSIRSWVGRWIDNFLELHEEAFKLTVRLEEQRGDSN